MRNKIINLFCEGKLNEMPEFHDVHLDMGKRDKMDQKTKDRYAHTRTNFKLDKSFKVGSYVYEIYKKEGFCRIFIKRLKGVIGFMGATVEYMKVGMNEIEVAIISSVYVFEEYQGKGLGFDMYKILLNEYGVIMSDNTLTGSGGGGSFGIWKRLGEMEGVKIYTYDYYSDEIDRVDRIDSSLMGSGSSRFIASHKELN
jgi:GNAT superfamily N-acetyltransferase